MAIMAGLIFRLLYERGEFAELAAYITKTPETDPRLKESAYRTHKIFLYRNQEKRG